MLEQFTTDPVLPGSQISVLESKMRHVGYKLLYNYFYAMSKSRELVPCDSALGQNQRETSDYHMSEHFIW